MVIAVSLVVFVTRFTKQQAPGNKVQLGPEAGMPSLG
jgi:hypothetical protein